MQFRQYQDGSCDIVFNEDEKKIVQERGKLHLSDEGLKKFGNALMRIVSEWQVYFNKETQQIANGDDTIIEGK